MNPAYEQAARLLANRRDVKIVVLGANENVTDEMLGLDCEIWAVEPQPECVAKLQAQAVQDRRVHVVPFAVGERDGETTFIANRWSVTSSIRPPTFRGYTIGIPQNASAVINVPLAQVDTLVAKGLLPPAADLAILDVQGHEREVLQGGMKFFSSCWLALVEVTFKELYEGQALEPEVSELLSVCGLVLDRPPFDEVDWNKQDWTDAVYRRRP